MPTVPPELVLQVRYVGVLVYENAFYAGHFCPIHELFRRDCEREDSGERRPIHASAPTQRRQRFHSILATGVSAYPFHLNGFHFIDDQLSVAHVEAAAALPAALRIRDGLVRPFRRWTVDGLRALSRLLSGKPRACAPSTSSLPGAVVCVVFHEGRAASEPS